MSAEALYQAVKSGRVKLQDLNDSGKEALRSYMNEKAPAVMFQAHTGMAPNANVTQSPVMQQAQSFKPPAFNPMTASPQVDVTKSPIMQQAQQYTDTHPVVTQPAKQELPGRHLPVVGPLLRTMDKLADNPLSNAVAEYAMPNAGFIDQPNTNVRQQFLQDSGIKPATGIAKLAGQMIAPFAVPGAQLGTGGAIEVAANDALKAVPASNLTKSILTGAAVGGATGAGAEFAQGNGSVKDAAIQGATGALLGGGLSAAGTGLKGLIRGKSELPIQANQAADAQRTIPAVESKPSVTADNAAVDAAPTMKGNWFTNLFGHQGTGITPFGSMKKLNAGPLSTSDQIVKNGIKTDVNGLKDEVAAKARAAYQNFVDYLDPLKKISSDTYETAMDATRSNNLANTIVRDKLVNPEGEVVGEGLGNIFKKVARGQDDQFIDYLTLRHAKTRIERGERVYADNLGMTPEKVQERIDMYNKRHPGFEAIAKEWDGFNDNMLKTYGVNEGLISPEAYQAMREKNPNYSPMRRQFSRSEKPFRKSLQKTTSSSFTGQKAPIQKVSPTGSVRNIVDPRKSTIESAGAWVNAAMRNRVMQSMADSIARDPEAFKGVAEIIQPPKDRTDLTKLLLDGGEDDFVEGLNEDFKKLFQTGRVDGDNVVRAMVKGNPVYIKVHDPEIVKTLIGMGPQASNFLIDAMTVFSNLVKNGATGVMAPVFAIKGATMDLAQSAIQAKNPVTQVADTVHAIFSTIGDKFNIPGLKNLAEEYRRAGGEYSAALKGDRRLNTSIKNMTREPILSINGVSKGATNLALLPYRLLRGIGDAAENAPRMAAFKGEMRRLGGQKTPENVRQAMSQAREITTNFSRKGTLSRDIEAFVPYNNAAIQGVTRIAKGLKQNPVKTVAAIGTLAVLPKLYEYAQFHDDPDYQNLPARERYRFLIVHKNKDGTFTKIPMEPAYNSIGEITIEALRKYKDSDAQAFKGSMDALANAWLPPAVTGALQGVTQGGGADKSIAGAINSTVFAPAVALTSNQSFTGAPIVSKAISDRSPQYQYDERTSAVAKKLGPLVGMSPQKADYLMRSYGGDPARMILPLTSEQGQGNVKNTLLRNFNVDPVYSNTLSNDFYDEKAKLNQQYRDNQEVGAAFPTGYDDRLRKELNSTAKGSISDKISKLTAQKKDVSADKSLSDKARSDKLRMIQQQINQLYMMAIPQK